MVHDAEASAANQVAANDLKTLKMKAEEISKAVAGARVQLQAMLSVQRAQKAQLEAMLIQQQSTIEHLRAEAYNNAGVIADHVRLRKVHDQLVIAKQNELAMAKAAHLHDQQVEQKEQAENAQLNVWLDNEAAKQANLKGQLITMNQYGQACHKRVSELEKEMVAASKTIVVETKESALLETVQAHANVADEAAMQRLQAEKMILRAEQESQKEYAELKQKTQVYDALKDHIVHQFNDIRSQMQGSVARIKVLNEGIRQNIAASSEAKTKVDLLDKTRQELIVELDPSKMAVVKAEHHALQDAYNRTEVTLHKSKLAETMAFTDAQEAKAGAMAAQEAVKISKEQALQAVAEGEAEVRAAVAEAEANKQEARKKKEDAAAALEMKCREEWDVRSATMKKQQTECKALKSELEVAQAQADTLKETLKAQVSADTVAAG